MRSLGLQSATWSSGFSQSPRALEFLKRWMVGVKRAAITRQTLRGGPLLMFARVTLTAPGVPVVR
jgi:hypothetical protein